VHENRFHCLEFQKLALHVTPNNIYDALSEELRYWKRKTGTVPTERQESSHQKSDASEQSSMEVGLRHYLIVAFDVHN